jgi:type IV fimbrial biogenesis protein FimT
MADIPRRRSRSAGYTLPELLTAVAVVSIVLASTAPGFQHSLRQARLNAYLGELTQSLQLARSEAAKRNAPVHVCIRDETQACDPLVTDWERGWLVLAEDGAVLRVSPALRSGYTLRSSAGTLPRQVTFLPTGVTTALGRFVLCEAGDLTRSRALFISLTGRLRLGQDQNGNGIPELADGTDIDSCNP